MRTKTLLLSAAALAAGVATSMAANVYSVNVVGYVNVNVTSGYNLISNPLDVDGVDNVLTVMPVVADGTVLLPWLTSGSFDSPIQYIAAGNGWYDTGFNPATNNIPPGSSFFIQSPSAGTITFVGTVVQGTNHQSVTPGYNFLASVPPIASDLDTNGFPAQDGMTYTTFAAGNYSAPIQYIAAGLGWYDTGFTQQFPTPAVAQGFVVFNPNPTTYAWTSTFTVQ
jgi:hypothetical protein